MKALHTLACAVLAAATFSFTLPLSAADKGSTTSKGADVTPHKKMAKVDVNTADVATLESLPGVGPQIAKAIVAERPFASVDDLERVQGIGPARLAELRDLVTVSHTNKGKERAAEKRSAKAEAKANAKSARAPVAAQTPEEPRSSRASTVERTERPIEPTGRIDSTRTGTEPRSPVAAPNRTGRLVNLNTATLQELEALPEIGPVKARAIIDARPFSSVEDVMRVKGIKEGTFNAIKDQITVR